MDSSERLHRQTGKPEWADIPSSKWNKWQKRAYETNGWDTPANRISALGLSSTILGLGLLTSSDARIQTVGLGAVGAGRYLDILDGKKAHETGTKSPKGEAIDATFDKIATVGAVAVGLSTNVIPEPELIAITAQQSANVILATIAKRRKREIHPGFGGKYGMFALWVGMGLHFAGDIVKNAGNDTLGNALHSIGSITVYSGVALGSVSTVHEYTPAAFGKSNQI